MEKFNEVRKMAEISKQVWDTTELLIKKFISGEIRAKKAVVILNTEDNLKAFTKERIRLISEIKNKNPKTIRELAKTLNREVSAVDRDVKMLEQMEIIKLEKNGNTTIPKVDAEIFIVPLVDIEKSMKVIQ